MVCARSALMHPGDLNAHAGPYIQIPIELKAGGWTYYTHHHHRGEPRLPVCVYRSSSS
jgi:hypothetical protein